jgi:hypothetical protein
MPIPIVTVEEHHEAFLVWNHALLAGTIPAAKNTLLHVDEHADMGLPHLRVPLRAIRGDLRAIQRFTYSEISIYEFITTAVYQGLFDRLYWLQRATPHRQMQQIAVSSHAGQGLALRLSAGPAAPDSDGESAVYFVQTLEHGFAPGASTVLDIDLDYFSCDQAERQVQRLEVTAAEFQSLRENPYHFLRINQGNRVQARCEHGRYFLYLKEYQDDAPCPLRMPAELIRRRIEDLRDYLERHTVSPRLITVARSRLSGYTPADQWRFIETNLLEMLARIYDLEYHSLADIAPDPVPAPEEIQWAGGTR